MALQTVRQFPGIVNARKDITPIAIALQNAILGHREKQETLRLEGIETKRQVLRNFGLQASRIRSMQDGVKSEDRFTVMQKQKTEFFQLIREAQARGEDVTQLFEKVSSAQTSDDLNNVLSQIVTRAAAADDQVNTALLKQATGVGGDKQFAASAVSKLLEGGGTRKILPDGNEEIRNRFNQIVTGQDAVDVLERSAKIIADKEEATQDLRVETERSLKQVRNAENTSNKAFDAIDKLRQNISNLEQVVPLIGEGANTGPISRLFPSVKAATIKLEQLQKRLSLDVVGSVTFGALSKGELDLAQAVAIPLGLEGDPLIQWVNDTISAKRKLMNYLEDQAIFLSNGGTQTEWLQKLRAELEGLLVRASATEEDIVETMALEKMTRSQVLDELKRRFPDGS